MRVMVPVVVEAVIMPGLSDLLDLHVAEPGGIQQVPVPGGLGEGEEGAVGSERIAGQALAGLVDRASQRCDPRIPVGPTENGVGEPPAVPEHPACLAQRSM